MIACSAVDCLGEPGHYSFPPGEYFFDRPVTLVADPLDRYTVIEGAGPRLTTLHFTGDEFAFVLDGAAGVTFKDLSISISPEAKGALRLVDANYNRLHNVIIEGSPASGTGIVLETVDSTTSHNAFDTLFLANLGVGMTFDGDSNSNMFQDLTFQGAVQQPLQLDGSTNTFVHMQVLHGDPAFFIGPNARSNSFISVTFDGPARGIHAERGNTGNVFVGLTLTTRPTGAGASALNFVSSSHSGRSSQAEHDVQRKGTQLGPVTRDQLKDQPEGTIVYFSNCGRSTSCARGRGAFAFKTPRGWVCAL
ncbi:MAG: hypothetical protein FJ144_18270 [Deltaproteobacteria bacterium]|nr:hypothetical protein [Deltaproteobacteria bacterium]